VRVAEDVVETAGEEVALRRARVEFKLELNIEGVLLVVAV